MFEKFSEFGKILVTGPQRSGTRICSKMIAYDTGYEFIDEAEIESDSMYRLSMFLEKKRPLVIHCPVLCRYVHMFSADDLAIVLMRRRVEDIVASQQRIGWKWERLELARYDCSEGVISEVKYRFWEQYQKERIKHAFEVEYDGLAGHPLWTAKDLRQNFSPVQTSLLVYPSEKERNVRPVPYHGVEYIDKLNQGSAILIRVKENVKLLNETGQFIWNLCDGTHTRQDILQVLQMEFADTSIDILSSDLDNFIWDLVSNSFLRFDESATR